MDYSRFLSARTPTGGSTLWNEAKRIVLSGNPLPFDMAFGVPDSSTFPFQKAKVTLKDGQKLDIDPQDMATALQYNSSSGYPPMVKHIKTLIQRIHDPPLWSDRDVIITTGSLDGLGKVFQLFLNKGDFLFIPRPCYHGVFVAGKHLLPTFMSVKADGEGIIPESLREALVRCKNSKGVSKLLYVNPGGSNPTGSILSEHRRRVIYDLACEYDLIIVEDDPYYFLQFSDKVPPSFLQLDTEGRVIRLESFSKTLGAGLRLGYLVAPKPIAKFLSQMVYGTDMLTTVLPQVLVTHLFDIWGLDEFLLRNKTSQNFYRSQRDIILQAAEKHLKELCEWTVPSGGFYLWLKVPKLRDTKNLLLECGQKRNVVLVPGCGFYENSSDHSQYMRASYATTNEEEVDKAFEILAEAIREEIKKEES